MMIRCLTMMTALSLIACGGGGGDGSVPYPMNGGNNTSTSNEPQRAGAATLRVVNSASQTIVYLYVSRSSESAWGPDQLGASVIARGSAYTLNGVPCGIDMDLKAENASHQVIASRFRTALSCGTNTWTIY